MKQITYKFTLSELKSYLSKTGWYSKEALTWAAQKRIQLVAEQLPIANLIGLDKNLFEYRKILYKNSKVILL